MATNYDAGYRLYLDRFHARFGEKPEGTQVEFETYTVHKLTRAEFQQRLDHYLIAHGACKKMIAGGSTISEPVAISFQLAAAWIAIEPPDVLAMFRGEIGDPGAAAPSTSASAES